MPLTAAEAVAAPLLELRGVVKRFGGVTALGGVDFTLRTGEVHALCGENGAGKSTLIKLLSGVHPAGSFEGEYRVDGRPAQFRSLRDARRAGIAVIYQELVLVDELTVAENIFLGEELGLAAGGLRGRLLDRPRMRAEAAALLARFGLGQGVGNSGGGGLDPDAPVRSLGVGQKQLVEIAKALQRAARVLILDEPTAALPEREAAVLLERVAELRRRGVACVYISHKLDEVLAIADRVTVLRDGKSVASAPRAGLQPQDIIRHMVGREIRELYPPRAKAAGDAPVLEVRGLSVAARPGAPPRLRDVGLTLRPGEVLGLGGLLGAGRTELLLHLYGAWGVRLCGSVRLGGQELAPRSPAEALSRGLALVSEERRRYGLIMDESIGFNLSLSSLGTVLRGGLLRLLSLLDRRRERGRNTDTAARLRVKAPGLRTAVRGLSGGNQQKVVLGKALLAAPRVLLLDEPTRGVDVGAKAEIYALVRALCDGGLGVLMVSSELPELIGMSDRVVMLRDGAVAGHFAGHGATPERLIAAALGAAPPATAHAGP